MIKDYEIKLIDNTEVLYLYIDFNSEFAKINSKRKKKKLKKYVSDYIKRHNIDFKGTTVALMAGGVMIGTIILNNPINNKSNTFYSSNDNYIVSLVKNTENIIDIEDEYIEEDVKITNSNEVTDNVNIENNNVNSSKTSTSSTNFNEKTTDTVINNSNITTNNSEITDNTSSTEIDNSKTIVTIYRTSGEILNLELEEYLIGVVGAEMPASFNIEALKSQAVVARTYTLKAIKNGKKLTDNSSTQNYKNNSELKSMWGSNYTTYYNKIKNAVDSTKGLYLSYNGEYIEAVYHSTSNGKTENSKYVWGNSFPYLVSVDSPYDSTNKTFLSTTFISNEILSNKLGQIITSETTYNIVSRNESGRVDTILIDNIFYTGVELRTKLGLRSTDFDIEITSDGINITTRGYGHGVGMSQYGANGMANNGYDFKSILTHYYTGVSINYRE